MAIKKIKEDSSFNINHKFFLIEEDDDLQEIEQFYSCEQGDIAELPTGAQYIRNSNGEWILQPLSDGGGGGGPSVNVESISITQNGQTIAPYGKAYTPINVNVPNTYIAEDEGKVVSNGGLVSQTNLSVTQNNTYNTTTVNSVTVNVPPTGADAPEKDVNFIDYDGKIVYSYIKSDFLQLNTLPENPVHSGLVAEGWNWILEDAKEYVNKYGSLWIGQNYTTTDGATEIDVKIPSGRQEISLNFNDTQSETTIDWGDSNTSTINYGTNSVTHNYANPGSYTIKISAEYGPAIRGSNGQSQLITKPGTSTDNENIIYLGFIKAIRATNVQLLEDSLCNCYNLETITTSTETQLASDIYDCNCTNCYSLKSFIIYDYLCPIFKNCYSLKNISFSKNSYINNNENFLNCTSLRKITLPDYGGYFFQDVFNGCAVLEEIYIPDNSGSILNSRAFQDCKNLRKIIISSNISEIKTKALYNCTGLKEIHFQRDTPPQILAGDVFTNLPTDCIIYVPSGRLSSYLNKTNYPNSSNYTYMEEA